LGWTSTSLTTQHHERTAAVLRTDGRLIRIFNRLLAPPVTLSFISPSLTAAEESVRNGRAQ
jgi:hypothetical protein